MTVLASNVRVCIFNLQQRYSIFQKTGACVKDGSYTRLRHALVMFRRTQVHKPAHRVLRQAFAIHRQQTVYQVSEGLLLRPQRQQHSRTLQ